MSKGRESNTTSRAVAWVVVLGGLLVGSCSGSGSASDTPIDGSVPFVEEGSDGELADTRGAVEGAATFDGVMAELDAALAGLGYEDFGGDHAGPESASFLVGRADSEELQITTGWEITGPQGTYETGPNPAADVNEIVRGDRAGVWITCGRFYVEILDLQGQSSQAEALADEIFPSICPR